MSAAGPIYVYKDKNHVSTGTDPDLRYMRKINDKGDFCVWGRYTSRELADDKGRPEKVGTVWTAFLRCITDNTLYWCTFDGKEPLNAHDKFTVERDKETNDLIFYNQTNRNDAANRWKYDCELDGNSMCNLGCDFDSNMVYNAEHRAVS